MLAQAALVELGLRFLSLSRVCALLRIHLGVDGLAPVHAQLATLSDSERRRIALVHRILARVPWDGRCLRRSLLIGHVLRHKHPVLRLGTVRRDGTLVFHAWVEVDGGFLDEGWSYRSLASIRGVDHPPNGQC